MNICDTPERLVLDLLRSQSEPLTFEHIIGRLPELTWNQVFLAVDALSRSGKIVLSRRGFEYQAVAADFA
jgi:hypothetical protein